MNDLSEAASNVRSIGQKVDQIAGATETANKGISRLNVSEDRRSEAEKEKRDAEVIRKYLRMKESSSQPWQTAQEDLAANRILGTGH